MIDGATALLFEIGKHLNDLTSCQNLRLLDTHGCVHCSNSIANTFTILNTQYRSHCRPIPRKRNPNHAHYYNKVNVSVIWPKLAERRQTQRPVTCRCRHTECQGVLIYWRRLPRGAACGSRWFARSRRRRMSLSLPNQPCHESTLSRVL